MNSIKMDSHCLSFNNVCITENDTIIIFEQVESVNKSMTLKL